MAGDYESHTDYIRWVKETSEQRQSLLEAAFRKAFQRFIETRQVEVVLFSDMTVQDLADAISLQPTILKPLLAVCSIAARAVERDLQIKNLDTYKPRLTSDQVKFLAGYLKTFLPPYAELPTLSGIDRLLFVDKEIRKQKGRWEEQIRVALSAFAGQEFSKRKFKVQGMPFELDAATPGAGPIQIGIDVKRIEARRDIHKRCDEIVNKASKFKEAFPSGLFGAVIYYPFVGEHLNVQNRLRSSAIDGIVFASANPESIENAAQMLLTMMRRS